MRRRRTTRVSQEELTQRALSEAHPFQKTAVLNLIAKRWVVSSVNFSPKGTRVIVLRFDGGRKSGIVVYPDGSGSRSEGTVRWDWDRAERAALATVAAGSTPSYD